MPTPETTSEKVWQCNNCKELHHTKYQPSQCSECDSMNFSQITIEVEKIRGKMQDLLNFTHNHD